MQHASIVNPPPQKKNIYKYKYILLCQCTKLFIHFCNLKRYFTAYSKETPYSCSECTKSIAISKPLKQYVMVHNKEEPCSECTMLFSRSSSLKRCTRAHVGILYCCSKCTKSWSQLKKQPDKTSWRKKWDYIWDTMMKDTISEQSLQRLELYNCIGLLLSFYSDFHITRIGMWISEVFYILYMFLRNFII